jgi:aspartokinase
MLKISDAVRETLFSSDVALIAFKHGWLNLTAYAESIIPRVEELTKKPVKRGSIVVALSRIHGSVDALPLQDEPIVRDITVRPQLVEVVYDKTKKSLHNLARLYQQQQLDPDDYLTVTQGNTEIAIVLEDKNRKAALTPYSRRKPKKIIRHLVSITLQFGVRDRQNTPVFYIISRRFAARQLHLVELISSANEVNCIVKEKDLQEAFLILNELFTRSTVASTQ